MPYRSQAQRAKFHAMADRGEISPATVKHWDEASKGKKLPEKVQGKKAEPMEVYHWATLLKAASPTDDVARLALTEEALRLNEETRPKSQPKPKPQLTNPKKGAAIMLSKAAAVQKMIYYVQHLANQVPVTSKVAQLERSAGIVQRLRGFASALGATRDISHSLTLVYPEKTAEARAAIAVALVHGLQVKLAKALTPDGLREALGLEKQAGPGLGGGALGAAVGAAAGTLGSAVPSPADAAARAVAQSKLLQGLGNARGGVIGAPSIVQTPRVKGPTKGSVLPATTLAQAVGNSKLLQGLGNARGGVIGDPSIVQTPRVKGPTKGSVLPQKSGGVQDALAGAGLGGLAGAGGMAAHGAILGGALGGAYGAINPGADEQGKRKSRLKAILQSALLGAGGGGLAGGVAGGVGGGLIGGVMGASGMGKLSRDQKYFAAHLFGLAKSFRSSRKTASVTVPNLSDRLEDLAVEYCMTRNLFQSVSAVFPEKSAETCQGLCQILALGYKQALGRALGLGASRHPSAALNGPGPTSQTLPISSAATASASTTTPGGAAPVATPAAAPPV